MLSGKLAPVLTRQNSLRVQGIFFGVATHVKYEKNVENEIICFRKSINIYSKHFSMGNIFSILIRKKIIENKKSYFLGQLCDVRKKFWVKLLYQKIST